MRRISGLVAMVLSWALVLTACGDDHHADPDDPDPRGDRITTTLVAPPTTTSGHGDDEGHGDVYEPIAEVAELPVTESAPTVLLAWEQLPLPDVGGDSGLFLGELLVLDDTLVLIGTSYPEFEEEIEEGDVSEEEAEERYREYISGIRRVAWISEAGSPWSPVDLVGFPPTDDLMWVTTEDGIAGIGTVWETVDAPYVAFTESSDGLIWETSELEHPSGASVYVNGLAMTPEGLPVAILQQEGFSEPVPISVTTGELEFTVSWEEDRVEVVDDSGEILFEESTEWLERFFEEGADNIVVPDAEGGELMTVEFAELEEAEAQLYEEASGTFAVVPDGDGGWDWVELDLEGSEVAYRGLASGLDGVYMVTTSWRDLVTSEVHRSLDGREWRPAARLGSPLNSLSRVDQGLVASGDAGDGGAAIWRSPDGSEWTPSLVVRGQQGSWSWASLLGGDGRRAVFGIDTWIDPEAGPGPVPLAVGEATMFVDGDFVSVRVDADDTITILMEGFVEDLMAEGALVVNGDVIDVIGGDGVIGSIGVDEFDAAMNASVPASDVGDPATPRRSLYLVDGEGTVELEGELPARFTPSRALFGDGTILLFGWETTEEAGASEHHEEESTRALYIARLP